MPTASRLKRVIPVSKAAQKAKVATNYLRANTQLRNSGAIGPKEKLPFDREPSPERKNPYKIETPPPTPARKLARKGTMSSPAIQTGPTLGPTSSMREFAEAAKKAKAVKNAALNSKKRKTEAVDDGQHNEAKKRKLWEQQDVARTPLASEPTASINSTAPKSTEPLQKRKREATDGDNAVPKKQKVIDPKKEKQLSSKPTSSSILPKEGKETIASKSTTSAPQQQPNHPIEVMDNEDGTLTMLNTYNGKKRILKPRKPDPMSQYLAQHGSRNQLAPGQKRKSEDGPTDNRKKAKVEASAKPPAPSDPTSQASRDQTNQKTSRSPAADAEKPRGLLNYKNASFANAVLQCLASCNELVNHYVPKRDKALSEQDIWGERPLTSAGAQGRNGKIARECLRDSLVNKVTQINVGAELGQIFDRLQQPCQEGESAEKHAVDPINFTQTFSMKRKRTIQRKPFDGETAENCGEFLQQLLAQLAREDVRTIDGETFPMRSLVSKLFRSGTIEFSKCDNCNETVEKNLESQYKIDLSVKERKNSSPKPKRERTSMALTEHLDHFIIEEPCPCRCVRCGKVGGVRKQRKLHLGADLPKYLAFATEAIFNGESKKKLPIEVPLRPIILRKYMHKPPAAGRPNDFPLTGSSSSRARPAAKANTGYYAKPLTEYKLFTFIEVKKDSVESGQYIATVKTANGWYQFDDHKVHKLPEDSAKWANKPRAGVLFFFEHDK